jgi:hypothetical protein
MPVVRLCCFVDLGMAAEQPHALVRRAPNPPDFLGAWWRVAERAPSKVPSDYYRFQLLTGCRGVEICGHKLHEYPPIRVGTSTMERVGAPAGHEEPERSQAAALEAGASDREGATALAKGRTSPSSRSWTPGRR